jgi:Kef-type K+ transport system membrane component KefB
MASVLPLVGVLFFAYLLARALGELCERVGLPALVGEIVAGIVIANVVVGSFHLENWVGLDPTTSSGIVNQDVLDALAGIGIVFLVFAVGLEVRPSSLRSFGRLSATTATWGTTVPFVLGVAFVLLVEGPSQWPAALFVGVALGVTSLIVSARVFRERDLLETTEAHVVLGAAVIEDVVGVVLLTVALGVTAGTEHGPIDLVYQVGVVVAFAVAFALFFLYLAPRVVRRYADPSIPKLVPLRFRTRNAVLVLVLLFCLGASALAASFQLASIVGALFAGMALSEYRARYDLRNAFETLNTFFVPFFFVSIGLAVSSADLVAVWPLAAALSVLAIVAKLTGVPHESRHLGRLPAFRVGVGMVPRAEVAIIVAITAYDAGLLTGDLYTAIVVMAIVTSIVGAAWLHYLVRGSTGGPAPEEPEATGL